MGKLFCIMGKSASGKDSLFKQLMEDESLSLHEIVTYTTRPIRAKEVDGREYHFVSASRFMEMEAAGKVIERRTYQTVMGPWHYFTADDGQIDLSKGSFLQIGTLEAYLKLRDYFGTDQVVPLYIEVEDGDRLERAIRRERKQASPNFAEVCRRFLADAEDFSEEKLQAAGINVRFENADRDQCYQMLAGAIRNAEILQGQI